jgi:hypothetical protein
MAWSNSKVFGAFLYSGYNASQFKLASSGDTLKAALYNNTTAPDNTVAPASSAYNTGTWATSNEVTSSTGGWASGGITLTSQSLTQSSAVVTFTAANTSSSTSSATISGAYGCLVYDSTVSSYGISFNYFGGTQSVTNGTFTIVWNASGIATFTAS